MYVPRFNAVEDEGEVRSMVAAARTAWLVTVGSDGTPAGTLVPILWEARTVFAHVAKANGQWRQISDDSKALLIISGPDAYISPSWYAAKAEHGKVVPTWNYTAVHLTGTVRLHHEPEWLLQVVTRLTEAHELQRSAPWSVTDAPGDYIAAQLKAIVGIEFMVDHVEGKAKLSQNRSDADRHGVVAGLRQEDDADARAIAAVMALNVSPVDDALG